MPLRGPAGERLSIPSIPGEVLKEASEVCEVEHLIVVAVEAVQQVPSLLVAAIRQYMLLGTPEEDGQETPTLRSKVEEQGCLHRVPYLGKCVSQPLSYFSTPASGVPGHSLFAKRRPSSLPNVQNHSPSVSQTSSSFRASVTRTVLSMATICRRLSNNDSTDCACCSGSAAGGAAPMVAPGDIVFAGDDEPAAVLPMPGSALPAALVDVPPARDTRLVCSSWLRGLEGGAPAARDGDPVDDIWHTQASATAKRRCHSWECLV
jgi:hypothetical protein